MNKLLLFLLINLNNYSMEMETIPNNPDLNKIEGLMEENISNSEIKKMFELLTKLEEQRENKQTNNSASCLENPKIKLAVLATISTAITAIVTLILHFSQC